MESDDDNVYINPLVMKQIIDDLVEQARDNYKGDTVSRHILRQSRPFWNCKCGLTKYEDLGDRIKCFGCQREYDVTDDNGS